MERKANIKKIALTLPYPLFSPLGGMETISSLI
jgi:hypothetical protein